MKNFSTCSEITSHKLRVALKIYEGKITVLNCTQLVAFMECYLSFTYSQSRNFEFHEDFKFQILKKKKKLEVSFIRFCETQVVKGVKNKYIFLKTENTSKEEIEKS